MILPMPRMEFTSHNNNTESFDEADVTCTRVYVTSAYFAPKIKGSFLELLQEYANMRRRATPNQTEDCP